MRDLTIGENAGPSPGRSTKGRSPSGGKGVSLTVLGLVLLSAVAHLLQEPYGSFSAIGLNLIACVVILNWARQAWRAHASPPQDIALKEIFESAGPMVLAIGLDGSITHMNPAAERMLGYFASELVGTLRTAEILAEGEGPRLIAELQRLNGVEPNPDLAPLQRLVVLMDTVSNMPPSQVPSFEAQLPP